MNFLAFILFFIFLLFLIFLLVLVIYIDKKITELQTQMILKCNNFSVVDYLSSQEIDDFYIDPSDPSVDFGSQIYKLNYNYSFYQCSELSTFPPILPDSFNYFNFTGKNNYAIIYSNKFNLVIILITGTNTFNKIFYDLKYTQIKTKFGQVHCGFYDYYTSLEKSLENDLKSIQEIHDIDNIIFSGHSLGAAASTLALMYIKPLINQNINLFLYTYGSPRIGDNEFASSFNNMPEIKSYRFANTSDIVTELPPSIIKGYYYTHIGLVKPFTNNFNNYSDNHILSYLDIGSSQE